MTNFTAKIAGIATLALAMLPAAALTTAARAETPHAHVAHVRIADLDLASAPGKAALAQRTHRAADAFCGDHRQLSVRAACEAAVRHEVQDKLAMTRQGQLQLARN
jgi:UrcA family protein